MKCPKLVLRDLGTKVVSMSGSVLYVFVYGTLKKGQPNHYLLLDSANGKATYLGQAVTKERLPLVVGSVVNDPYLLPEQGRGEVGKPYQSSAKAVHRTLD